jgi:hypothetical protein
MNRRTLFKVLAAIPFVRSIPAVRRRVYDAARVRISIGGVAFDAFDPDLTYGKFHDEVVAGLEGTT